MKQEMIDHSLATSWTGEPQMLLPERATAVPVSIVLYGTDEMLLRTRAWLLEGCGYRVRTAGDLAELNRMASEGAVDLLVLCHSMAAEEAGRAAAMVLARRPGARVVVLTSTAAGHANRLLADRIDAGEGPARFVAGIARMAGTIRSLRVRDAAGKSDSPRRQ